MQREDLRKLTNQELLQEKKKADGANITTAVIIGFLVGVFIYAAINKGFSFFTIAPLGLVYFFIRNKKDTKALKEEIKSRGL